MGGCHTESMADLDRVAIRISDGLRNVLRRVGTLALGMTAIATLVGVATFVTGWWIFDGSRPTWALFGGALCFAPALAALIAWALVRATAKFAPALVGDVRTLLDDSRGAADVRFTSDASSCRRCTPASGRSPTFRAWRPSPCSARSLWACSAPSC